MYESTRFYSSTWTKTTAYSFLKLLVQLCSIMAYLYAYSPRWRQLINATRNNPKMMFAFVTATTGAGVLFWKGSEELTRVSMGTTEEEMRELHESDDNLQRYAKNSERALATMFAKFGKGQEENAKYLNDGQAKMKIPGVEWHPKAEQRDKQDIVNNK